MPLISFRVWIECNQSSFFLFEGYQIILGSWLNYYGVLLATKLYCGKQFNAEKNQADEAFTNNR